MSAARRSRLVARGVLALLALSLSAAVIHQGIANWLSRGDPARAARLAPSNARIAVDAARAAIEKGESPSAAGVRALVDAALSRDVTLTAAIEFRALDAAASGNRERAARLFLLSSTISRRSLPTRLWLIQDAVDRGDVEGALDQFDIALRTSSAAPDVLFPVLAEAASDPALAAPIARVLDRPTEWRAMFLHHALTEAEAAPQLANVVLRMRDRAMVRDSVLGGLIAQLVARRDFASARAVHGTFAAEAGEDGYVQDGRFARPAAEFPFGWGLVDRGNAGAVRSMHGGRPVLVYRSTSGGDGQVATQLLMLPPGAYALSASSAESASDPGAPAYWTITCAEENGPQIALLDQPAAGGASASQHFSVPAGCTAQWLALNLRFSDAPQGQYGSIASVAVAPR